MNARQVHAVLAAGVENPGLIARWRREPQLLRSYGIEPDTVDLDGLWKFAGLTVKVRHNAIREDLPLTFRLMSVAGLEIEIFAAYAGDRASKGARYASTAEARACDLVDFLEHWLDLERPGHSLLWDMLRHERALAQLTKSAPPSGPGAERVGGPRTAPSSATLPRVRGKIILHEMRSDPRAVGAALRASAPRLPGVLLEPAYFCYWRADAAKEISIVQLDAFGFYILSFVDGARSAADLNRELGGGKKPTRAFLQLLGELGALGILELGRPR